MCEGGGTDGRRDAGIFPAHVPVVALSKSPSFAGTKSMCACWEHINIHNIIYKNLDT